LPDAVGAASVMLDRNRIGAVHYSLLDNMHGQPGRLFH
jgi:hypothetical protein